MKIRCTQTLAASIVVFSGAILSPAVATAGCGSFSPGRLSHLSPAPHALQFQSTEESEEAWHSDGLEPVVGMWNVQFTATDSSGFTDFGYSQWHSDGTEILNSGSRAPSTQNYCLGVWAKTGEGSYKLNHFALSYDASTGDLNGKVNIREQVKVSANARRYSGTFTIDVYDPTGTIVVAHVQGNITGKRVTVNTQTP